MNAMSDYIGPVLIPGSAHALGYRGDRAYMHEKDLMLAREWWRLMLFQAGRLGPGPFEGYFTDPPPKGHPEHIEPYRLMTVNPPDPAPPGPIEEHLIAALNAWPRWVGKRAKAEVNYALTKARVVGV